jgi:transposase-like protein
MVFDIEFLRELLSSNMPLRETFNQVLTILVNEMLQVEANDFILNNNQKLPDGRNRLVLNGSYQRDILSTSGILNLQVPTVQDRGDASPKLDFRTSMLPRYLKRLDDLTDLIPWMYLYGFSTAQFEDVFSIIYGPGFKGLSPSTVSAVVRSWNSDYDEWAKRDLTGQFFPYLWADGVHFNIRGEKANNQAVLLFIGYNREGKKELLSLTEGIEEDSETWRGMFMDVRERGLDPPLLVIGDAGKGLWKGLSSVFPDCGHQHCWKHKQANVSSCLPTKLHREAAKRLQDVQRQENRADALKAADAFRLRFGDKHPKAVLSLTRNLDELLRFYDYPSVHWIHLRTNNPLENVFSTVRLRTCRMRGMAGRKTVLTMVYRLAQIACGHSRAINGVAQMAQICNGVKFKDGEAVADECRDTGEKGSPCG